MIELSSLYNDLAQVGAQVFLYDIGFAESATLALGPKADTYGVFIDRHSLRGRADLKGKLAHEWGHCATGALHKTSSPWDLVEKHEHKAWRWSIERYLPFEKLRTAMIDGLTEPWQLADWFDFPEEYIRRALHYYTETRGLRFDA
jgi:hypothetical protein